MAAPLRTCPSCDSSPGPALVGWLVEMTGKGTDKDEAMVVNSIIANGNNLNMENHFLVTISPEPTHMGSATSRIPSDRLLRNKDG